MQNGTPYNLPLTVDLHIEKFSGAQITQVETASTNLVYDQYQDGRWYATQRPGINQLEDASASVSDKRGRGAYYWDAVGDKYIVNAGKVYKGSYAGTSMTISTGIARVFIYEIGNYLVIIDQENNEGWTITSSAPTTINAITDIDFPPNQTPALSLARGGAVLNGKLYLPTTTGEIVESDIEDPTAWGALNFRDSEVEPDNGVLLAKHHEYIVMLGTRSTEFFQDTGNPTGSTLSAWTGTQYQVGAVDADSWWQVGENLYFVGQDRSGAIGVYVISGMQLSKVSGEDFDTFLTTAITQDNVSVTGCGFSSGGRDYFALTMSNIITDNVPVQTVVFNSKRQWWGFWDVYLPDVDYFPLMSWMPSPGTRAGEGILINGDLVTVLDDFNPVDTVNASGVYETGVFEAGVFTTTDASGTNIAFEAILGVMDGGTTRRKRMGDIWLVGTPTAVSEDVTISFADEQNTTYDSGRTIDVSDSESRLNRNGSFRRRNIKITGTLSEQIRAEKLQTTVRAG